MEKNDEPGKNSPKGAPRDAVKIDFARRLQRAMVQKGWNQSELARRASEHLPGKKKIGRDSISHYIRGVAIPQPAKLKALCDALGLKPIDLLPAAPSATQKAPPFDMRQLEDGSVWLRVNQPVSFDQALKIMEVLKRSEGRAP